MHHSRLLVVHLAILGLVVANVALASGTALAAEASAGGPRPVASSNGPCLVVGGIVIEDCRCTIDPSKGDGVLECVIGPCELRDDPATGAPRLVCELPEPPCLVVDEQGVRECPPPDPPCDGNKTCDPCEGSAPFCCDGQPSDVPCECRDAKPGTTDCHGDCDPAQSFDCCKRWMTPEDCCAKYDFVECHPCVPPPGSPLPPIPPIPIDGVDIPRPSSLPLAPMPPRDPCDPPCNPGPPPLCCENVPLPDGIIDAPLPCDPCSLLATNAPAIPDCTPDPCFGDLNSCCALLPTGCSPCPPVTTPLGGLCCAIAPGGPSLACIAGPCTISENGTVVVAQCVVGPCRIGLGPGGVSIPACVPDPCARVPRACDPDPCQGRPLRDCVDVPVPCTPRIQDCLPDDLCLGLTDDCDPRGASRASVEEERSAYAHHVARLEGGALAG